MCYCANDTGIVFCDLDATWQKVLEYFGTKIPPDLQMIKQNCRQRESLRQLFEVTQDFPRKSSRIGANDPPEIGKNGHRDNGVVVNHEGFIQILSYQGISSPFE